MSSQNRISLRYPKRLFDPTSTADLAEYQYFLEHNRWRDLCPFVCEPPFESVIFMIERKIVTRWMQEIMSSIDNRMAA
jgi:hypothetical protein